MKQDAELCPILEAVLPCDAGLALQLLAHGRIRTIHARSFLAQQGDIVGTLWLVLQGRIKLESSSSSGRSSRLGVYGPGDWIGSYARPAACSADIATLDTVTLLSFASGDLPALALREPQIGVALAASFARQLENTLARLDARSTLTAKGRIYAELLHRAAGGLALAPCPVVAELALAAQTTRETASRAIADLERRGIITRDAARLTIHSPRLLTDLVV